MKKGFTLMELLAIIVILAIIATIATPVVLSIINDSKSNSLLKSANFYLKAVETTIMTKNMNSGGVFNPSSCKVLDKGNLECDGDEENPITIEVTGIVPNGGNIELSNGTIREATVTYGAKTIKKNTSGEILFEDSNNIEEVPIKTICTAVTEETKTVGTVPINDLETGERIYTPGDEYICEVADGKNYRFFVLNTGSETIGDANRDIVNLIMDSNITPTGEPITSSELIGNSNTVWISSEDYGNATVKNDKGPVTAMNYLYEATNTWENLENIQINYINSDSNDYAGITTEGNITTIKMNDETVTATYENLKARLPGSTELLISCGGDGSSNGSCKRIPWIHNNVNLYGLSGIDGYWTMSTHPSAYNNEAIGTLADGRVWYYRPLNSPTTVGVRPVIAVSKSDIS